MIDNKLRDELSNRNIEVIQNTDGSYDLLIHDARKFKGTYKSTAPTIRKYLESIGAEFETTDATLFGQPIGGWVIRAKEQSK